MSNLRAPSWQTLSPLLDELLALDAAAAREARLGELRRDNSALADGLAALIAQQTAIERELFLDGNAFRGEGGADTSLAGRTIGAYTLESTLGAGGMGSVWLARRGDGR